MDDGFDDDDTWFDTQSQRRGYGRPRTNLLLVASIVGVGVLGGVLGAFASPGAGVDPAIESMRSRARAADGTRPLSGATLLERLERAASVAVPPAREVAAEVAAPADEPRPEAPELVVEAPPVAPEPEPVAVVEVAPTPNEPPRTPRVRPPTEAALRPVEAPAEPVRPPEPVKPPEPEPAEATPKSSIEQALLDGRGHLDARRWAEARQAFERALAGSPGNTKALFGRGRALFEMRQTSAAMKDFEAVLAAEPSHPNALLMAGSVSQELGRKDDARRFYQRYLDAWPTGRRAAEIKGLLERL